MDQLWEPSAVFNLKNPRARKYRASQDPIIGEQLSMYNLVFEIWDTSATGVCFTRDLHWEKRFFGEFLVNMRE
jgi:hypothetical protein